MEIVLNGLLVVVSAFVLKKNPPIYLGRITNGPVVWEEISGLGVLTTPSNLGFRKPFGKVGGRMEKISNSALLLVCDCSG